MLDKYQNALARLRTDRSRDRYPAVTNHAAPHKSFLLLSIIDLIDKALRALRATKLLS